jgi:putative redox protein
MDATVTWKSGMSFIGVGGGTNFPVALGSRPAPDHEADGASPMELILMGLAGCTAFDVVSILRKKRQDITGFEIHVHAERAQEHPRVFTHIMLEYVVTGRHVEEAAVKRSIELSLGKYCSVHAMLSKAVPIEHTCRVVEADTVAAHTSASRDGAGAAHHSEA